MEWICNKVFFLKKCLIALILFYCGVAHSNDFILVSHSYVDEVYALITPLLVYDTKKECESDIPKANLFLRDATKSDYKFELSCYDASVEIHNFYGLEVDRMENIDTKIRESFISGVKVFDDIEDCERINESYLDYIEKLVIDTVNRKKSGKKYNAALYFTTIYCKKR